VLLAAVILVSGGAYRVYPSSYDGRPSAVRFRLPLDGAVSVAWGGAATAVNYHVVAPDQRWAYDLLVLENGLSFRGSGLRLEDYLVYGRRIRSPAAGRVVMGVDGRLDEPIGAKWKGEEVLGNHVIVQVAEGEFLFVAHLQQGSVAVRPGDTIDAGQTLGRVGNSGKSSEPHVHLHLQNTPTVHFGEAIPMYFYGYRMGDSVVARGIPTGGIQRGRFVGQVVEQVW
jgi:murein DD-endopeptidase MepM/ murein hydrolase activator NlpD